MEHWLCLSFSQEWSEWLESGLCLASLSYKGGWQPCAVVSNTLIPPLKSREELTCFLFNSHSGSAMNVAFTEEEMKKFLAEATRVSQVTVFILLLLFLFVFAVFVSPLLCFPSLCFCIASSLLFLFLVWRGASEIRV